MKRCKVVHLSSVHPVTDSRIFLKECRMLAQNGFDVTFVVPHIRDEIIDGVYIRSVTKSTGRIKRMTITVWAVFLAALKERADIYHFHDPELIPIALLLKLFKKRVIYDVHEDLPRQIISKHWIYPGLRKWVSRIVERVERLSARAFDGIITVTPEIAKRFPHEKTKLVQNFPLRHEFYSNAALTDGNYPNTIVYLGGISNIRGAKEMIEAISLLPETLRVRLVLAGKFSPRTLKLELQQMEGWKRVDFVGWQSRSQIRELLAKATVGLVTLHPVPNYINSQPIKLFEYMSAAVPVVASDFPKWNKIVSESQCGLLVNPLNPYEIAKKIQYLIENPSIAQKMGNNGREAVQQHYVWEVEGEKMLELYHILAGDMKEGKREDAACKSGEE